MTVEDEMIKGKLQAKDMGQTCLFCMGRTFRRSRLKLKDVGGLLALHYPVRCLSCSKRQSVGLDVARKAVPSTVRQVRAPKNDSPWDGSPWSRPGVQPADRAAKMEPGFIGGGALSALNAAEAPAKKPTAMPDLHGVRLPHVAQMPPGNGENLA